MPPPLLCLHETASSGAAWDALAAELGTRFRVIAPDRAGWGEAEPPEGYRATTVDEQAEAAVERIAAPGDHPAVIAGAGIGAAIALNLMLARPELVAAAVLIEPPLLAFVPAATAAISADRAALEEAVVEGGPEAGAELYLSGSLSGLGTGAERLPLRLADEARRRPLSLFAELGAVPAWALPFGALRDAARPSAVVVSEGTPAPLHEAAAALAGRLAGSELVEFSGAGPAHLDAAAEVARLAERISAAGGPSS